MKVQGICDVRIGCKDFCGKEHLCITVLERFMQLQLFCYLNIVFLVM